MKKRLISMLLVICMLLTSLSVFAIGVSAADGGLPTSLTVEPSESSNIPAAIDLYKSGTVYHLYLPGNTDAANCFFSWEGSVKGSDGSNFYDSGALPIPPAGETRTYTFDNGTASTSFEVCTYQGSKNIKPLFIEIDESKGSIAAMNGDPKHDTTCTGIIFIDGEEYVLDQMKGRGNATWSSAIQKRPYNITLDKKVSSILGLKLPEKTKKFSLLANMADHSLLRNKIGYDLAYAMDVGLDSKSVDLWLNGEYLGLYQIVAKNDSFVSDDGYAVENDNYKEPPIAEGGDPSFELEGLSSSLNGWASVYNRISVKKIGDNLLPADDKGEPIETVETLSAAAALIQAYLQDLWDAVRSESGYNAKGKYYTDYIDLSSWAKMYLIQEYVKNYDAQAGSLLFHRDGTADTDKLFAGPLWDLDNALGSTYINNHLGNQVDQTDAYGVFMSNISDSKVSMFKTAGKHEDFMEEVYRVYNEYQHLFDALPSNVTSLAAEMKDSAEMNFKKVIRETYNTTGYSRDTTKQAGTEYEQNYKKTDSFQDYVDNLETYTAVRSLFFRNTMTREPENAYRVSFTYGPGSDVTVYPTRDTSAGGEKNPRYVYALDGETGEPSLDGRCEVNFRAGVQESYVFHGLSAAPAENYGELQDLGNGLYRLTNVKGAVAISVDSEVYVCPHEFENYVCKLCGEAAYKASFVCGEGSSVTVYESQDTTGPGLANAAVGYARDGDTGALDCSGNGQVNFVLKAAEGYRIKRVTAQPKENYKNLKLPTETGVENGYRVTKLTGDVTITVTTAKLGEGPDLPDIDFTNSKDAAKFEILNQADAAITEGEGLRLLTTKDAFEPCSGQLNTFSPKDVVKVPVTDDWTATLEFDADLSGAGNGYYQFFGMYAAEGNDYQRLAGIRGGDGTLQDFLRLDGVLTTDTEGLRSSPGIASSGTYWYQIIKEGSTYTCLRSADGESFTEMFAYEDTGIEAESILIDAYTGMTEGYVFTLKSLTFETSGSVEPPKCEHDYVVLVTAPTCLAGGYTTYTCSKCDDSYTGDEADALGHDYEEEVTAPTCTEQGFTTFTCTRCDDSYKGTETEALGHDYKEEVTLPTCLEGGHTTYTCKLCDDSYTGEEAAALGHEFIDGVCSRCGEKEIHDCPSKQYTDVPSLSDWAHAGIDYCVEEGLMNGTSDSLFSPANSLTRAQLVQILYRMEGEPEVEYKAETFSDVKEGVWYAKAVLWAAEKGYVNGYPNGTFAPNNKITREQIATILYRYAGSPAVEKDLSSFPDADEISSYAKAAMEWAVSKELINGLKSGETTILAPQNNATRAQFASIIMRYLEGT